MWIIKKKNELDPQLGIYDMRSYIPMDAPEQLKKLVGRNIAMKGGGGQQTTTSGVPAWAEGSLKKVFADAEKQYFQNIEDGPGATIAALTPEQKEASKAKAALARDAIAGRGQFDLTRATQQGVQDAMGTSMGMAAGAGTLGSARSQGAMNSAIANRYDQMRAEQLANQEAGLGALSQVGQQGRDYEQQKLDADDIERGKFFGYAHGTGQTSTTTGGGGK